ncbi:MAG: archease [Candidatus Lambdaproteobacteria bacterium]|nr:archease [Candidatus Lambdaproteobacteria bacterium]
MTRNKTGADRVQAPAETESPAGKCGWEHFEHQADIGVRGYGPTREAAFEQAALALTAVLTEPALVAAREQVALSCQAPDDELLLVDWLNALVYEMGVRRMLFGRFTVRLTDHRLDAVVWGEAVNRAVHQPAVEVKGATYTALRVAREEGHWVAQCVVDV